MAESTPDGTTQVVQAEPTPVANGITATETADVAMADSTEIPESTEVILSPFSQACLINVV